MAARRGMIAILVSLGIVVTLWAEGMAQSSSCTNVLISMSPCLNYITGNSSTPSPQCCTQLGSLVRSQLECLCQVLDGGASSLGVNVNQTRAVALPTACNVQTPPISRCNASTPTNSPSGSSDSPPSGNGGSETVPSTDNGTSNGNAHKSNLSSFFFFLLLSVASHA